MPESLTRQRILNYLEAFYSGNLQRALDQCANDIDYIGYAPIELFPHLGHKHGKDDVAATLKHLHKVYASMRYEILFLAVEDPKAAVMLRVNLVKRSNGRVVQIQLADFYTCRGGVIAEHRQFMDSFDAVQQTFERDIVETLKTQDS